MVGGFGVSLRRPTWLPVVLLSAVLAAVLLALDPHVHDMAAQVFRTELFERTGFSLWNGSWYGGHYVLTYSVLFPPLAALFGARFVGAASVVASAYLFDRLVRDRWGEQARPASLWYGVGAVTMLASGRLSFALGVALALAALRALQCGRPVVSTTAALGCALASPVAAMFLAGVMTVVALARRTDGRLLVPLAIGATAVAPVAALNLVFSEKGLEPFAFSAWIALPLWCGGALYVTRGNRAERELRAGIVGYLLVGTLIWMVPNPLGGNATRLGALFGGPLLLAALRSRRVRLTTPAVALVLVGSVWWQGTAAVRDVARSFGDPSTRAAYYEPLARWLRVHGGPGVRIEVPFTSGHWETAYLAPEFELARGWLRQLDRSRNGLFYRDRLPSARYRAWLVRSGIRYVALADTATDYSARAERRVIESRPHYLRLKARLQHWRVYRVVGARPLAQSLDDGRGRLRELRPSSFTLAVTKPGRFLVRIRGTPYWSVRTGNACVGQTGPWTVVRADRPGTVRASIRFSFSAAARAATGRRRIC